MSKRSSKQRFLLCETLGERKASLPEVLPKESGAKKSKHQGKTQKRLIQTLFKNAHDAIALIDDRLCLVDMNIATSDLLGLSRKQLKGQVLANFITAEFACQPNSLSFPPGQSLMGELLVSSSAQNQREMEYTLIPNVLPHCHLLLLRDISQRRESMQAELRQQQQRVELFSEVTLKIRQSLQLKEILHTTVTEVQRILQADRVLIYQVLPDGTGKTISEAVLPDYPTLMDLEFPEEVFPQEYQQLYAHGRVRATADVHDPAAGLADCLVEFVDQFQIKAKLIVPIVQNLNAQSQNHLWGLLIAHQCDSVRHWVDFELELMQQLADQISIALSQAQLLERLEEVVADRTAELQEEINVRMQAEAALRQSEEQLRLITNALPVLIAYVDDQQQYRFNNQAYQDWLGQSPKEIYGSHLQQVWGEDCYQRMQVYVKTALSGQAVNYENDILLKDGSWRSVDVTYIPDVDDQNTVKGFFALSSDISDRKAIERMKDEFISVISHELRTPLTSLHSALKILATGRLGTLSTEGQQMLGIADDSTERLVRLVNNVLDLQRIESGKVIMECQACNAANLMIQAAEAMQAMAQQHEITLVKQPQDISVWADADYILQALTNLISNAIKFSSPGGTVWLTVEQEQGSQNLPKELVFRVRDEGQGIPADQLERIFEKFQQVDSSDSRKKGGTGLGLTICRKIIEQHNGRIWAESTPGSGSTFAFTLPTLECVNISWRVSYEYEADFNY
ncbi:two-component hybrid sensor and regulator [Nostoc commune NIES-4072]|uniref:histidine kinase n=1 Tax=Nostoc commune NIES-4072 TaxID=2005467 RepID=A0A2R5FT90_NOSCO|nr:ATP-binding protein [Nostoc commune]BBD63785.1 two-component hybrid sensor and regulator [Nostoc commune HK-02]GBG18894.1 two-component hybrid sensor and regulator [Nostoc commune NIES-4072]